MSIGVGISTISGDCSYHEFLAVLGLSFLLLFAEGGFSTVSSLKKKKNHCGNRCLLLDFNRRMLEYVVIHDHKILACDFQDPEGDSQFPNIAFFSFVDSQKEISN